MTFERTGRTARAPQHQPRIQLEMKLVDEEGNVLASTVEPFEVGRFDLAAARQGMRKLLAGLGGITSDQPPSAS